MHAERIEKASQRIQEVKQHQRLQVEKQLQEKAEKERRLEEAKQRELEEKLAKEDAKRIKMEKEAEEKRIAAEKRRREQELKEDEKRRKKEEKERIKREKEEERERIRKEKEEQKRLQQEQEEAEKIKRLEEEKERLFREEAKREELLRQREKKAELNADQQNSTASRLLLKQEKNQIETEKAGLEKCSAVNKAETEICLATSNTSEIKNESKSSLDKEKGEMRPTQVHNVMSTQVHNVMPTQVHNVISADEKASNRKCSTLSAISDSRLPTELPNAETSTLTTGKSVTKAPVTQNASLVEENAEKALKINEYKNWMEERKAKVAKANQKQAPSSLKQQEPIDPRVTEAKIEERRLRWIQECTPWSQVSGRALSNTGKARKSYKRPSSAAKHQKLIEEAVILREAGEESLLQVEAVQLTDLPGCRLSTLSRCKKLQALSVTRSGISAIDSLNSAASLVYTYFGGNAIDSIDLAVHSLVHLDLSSNNLTSMRGFDGCTNLKYLDISHNKISKLSNLSCIAFLHTLKAAHNQIISTKGLGECVTLQVVDLSSNHLTSIDEVGKLCLLRKLTASQNNIMEIPRLVNCVLLESLVLEDNSISSLDGLAYFWLPTLKEVNLTQNGVSAIQPLHGCFNLRTFNLSQNQLLDYKNVVDGLKLCINLEELLLNGNPLRNADISRKSICDALPQLKRLDGEECVNSESIELQSAVLNMANSAWIEHDNLERKYQSYLSDSLAKRIVSNAELLYAVRQLPTYYELSYRLAENVRYAHEFGSNSFETPHSSPTISSKELFQTKLASVENGSHVVTAASPSAKDLFEEKLKATLESTSLKVSADNIKLFKECNSPRPHSRHSKSKDQRTPSGVSTPRSARLRSSQMLSACNGETASTTHVPMRREMIDAAVKIQAVWRGYSFRQRLARALQQVKACSEESDEDIAEVDLSSFDFNVDDGWLPPDVPHLPQEHAILPRRSIQLKIDLDAASIPNGRVAAWLSPSEGFLESAANVDPPLSSMSGEISQRSKREEMIAQDWGFKDSHTAELMMKRAKKLKYNSQRKKKLDKLGPMGRYELQRKILQNIEPAKIIAPAKKTAPKKEYFKALEDAAERRTVAKSAEKTAAIERTYEWIHTQVGSRQPGENGREERISSGESQLPYMDKRLLDGGRTQLVQSPLEIMSVSSYNGPQSADSRDRGQSNSYSSKMTAHQRQVRKQAAVTAKNTGLEGFAAWGSGKKKNAR
ncbi:leucine-rich repeat and IQ domain-containing protein 1-like [Watersipora subatra]|uniref:leucine-rich repeat and IQ domain-containing protein 1-like n=1 Tax=Watersipora subatra TaxID=2589382 RepID=UPI00355C0C70